MTLRIPKPTTQTFDVGGENLMVIYSSMDILIRTWIPNSFPGFLFTSRDVFLCTIDGIGISWAFHVLHLGVGPAGSGGSV